MVTRGNGHATTVQESLSDRDLDVKFRLIFIGSIIAERTLRLDTGKLGVNRVVGDRVQSRQA